MKMAKYLMAMLCTMLFGAGMAMAQGSSTTAPGERSTTMEKGSNVSAQNLRTLTVTVKSTDPKNHKVTFEAQVKPEANIIDNGKPIALDQLKEGDMVRASFDPQTGELIKVQVLKKGASK